MKYLAILLIALLLISCSENYKLKTKILSIDSDTTVLAKMQIKYAKGFSVYYYKNYKKITVYNPWKNDQIFYEYIIVSDTSLLKQNQENKFYISTKKLENIAQLSSTQINMFQELGLLDRIKAVSTLSFLYNNTIIDKINKEQIIELGNDQNLNIEKCITQNFDAIFTTGWDKLNENYKKLIEQQIPVIFSFDWQEESPLGRAEWIKFISVFFNKEKIAENYFNNIEKKYIELQKIAKTSKNKPAVFNGYAINGTWYVAGSESYLVCLFNDANAQYIFSYNNSKGSVPLSIETVFAKAKNADFWVVTAGNDFLLSDNRYNMFKAKTNKNIYSNNNRINSFGGNDYWESAVIHPELQLQDFINIFHKNLLSDTNLIYHKKIIK